MIDAQPRSSLETVAAVNAQQGVAQLSRFFTRYIGIAILVATAIVWAQPDLRAQVFRLRAEPRDPALEVVSTGRIEPAPRAVPSSRERAAAFLDTIGDGQQARNLPLGKVSTRQADSLSRYIAGKYHVSNEATRMLISTAYGVGQDMAVDPLLLLAVMAIESSFNPFAESTVGAQGLMQVMTKVHSDRFEPFGGAQAAFNPVANVRVGAGILKEYIDRSGSLLGGLRLYVGVGPDGSSPYGDKVLAERRRLASVIGISPELPGLTTPTLKAPEQQTVAATESVAAL